MSLFPILNIICCSSLAFPIDPARDKNIGLLIELTFTFDDSQLYVCVFSFVFAVV